MSQASESSAATEQFEVANVQRRTLESYLEEWQGISPDGAEPWPDVLVNPEACIFGEFIAGSRTSGIWFRCFDDLGQVICYVRYYVLPNEVHLSYYRTPPDPEVLRQAAEQLDTLLRRYVTEGDNAELQAEFARICTATLREHQIAPIFVLPRDLTDVLYRFGNPLVEHEEEEELNEQSAPAFDPENPEHWEALQTRIDWYNENWG